jgi:hypothetical protein
MGFLQASESREPIRGLLHEEGSKTPTGIAEELEIESGVVSTDITGEIGLSSMDYLIG